MVKKVFEDNTNVYKQYPQLFKFKLSKQQIIGINFFLKYICIETSKRHYKFHPVKFIEIENKEKINVTTAQINFEKNHLRKKLKLRDKNKYNENIDTINYETQPLFNLINGEIEPWEKM